MTVVLAGRHFMMLYPKYLKLKLICTWAIQELNIIVKNVAGTTDTSSKTDQNLPVKDIVTTERVWCLKKMANKIKYFSKGSIDTAPLLLPVIPFGIIFGVIGMDLGFGPYVTYATSFIIFAGSSQVVFIQLISGGASSLVTLASVGIVNSRHLLYGAVLSSYK